MPEATKIPILQEVMKKTGQKYSSDLDYCSHHLGYLGQRSKSEEIPSTCLTCLKLVDCMLSKTETLEGRILAPVGRELSELRVERESDSDDGANVPVGRSAGETAKEEFKAAVDSEVRTQPLSRERSRNQFKVEDLDMLYASWSKTVRIDRQSLSDWGKRTGEVEIETVKGKRARCMVQSIEDSERGIIQVPDKIQLYLGIRKGELVTVKPIAKN